MNRLFGLMALMVFLIGAGSLRAAPPNILFIMTDQHSADALSCAMGTEHIRTPAIDSLAATGVRFTRAYVANPLCKPARNSIFTGHFPHETGVQSNSKEPDVAERFVNLGRIFADAGYDTGYIGKWHINYKESDNAVHGFKVMNTKLKDPQKAAPTLEFITKKRDKPFFVVASFMNPHNICQWARTEALPDGPIGADPDPALCPPLPSSILPATDEPDVIGLTRLAYHASKTFPIGNFDANKWRQGQWAYYRMIEMVDAEIGKILDGLRAAGLEKNTVVIFTSDHGECRGSHGFNQKTVFYEASTRVPLIISQAGTTAVGTNDLIVHTGIDLMPTMCDFAGIDRPDGLRGLSLRQAAEQNTNDSPREFIIVSNHLDQGDAVDGLRPSVHGRMVRTDRFKYAVYDQGVHREELYDMKNDPDERVNLARRASHREALLAHRAMLAKHAKETGDERAAGMLAGGVGPIPITHNGLKR